jgi:ketosteroid isomerase-like protein
MRGTVHHDDVESSRDLGFQRGRMALEIPAADRQQVITSRFVTVWRREPDGVWRMTGGISNTDAPAESGTLACATSLEA